MFEDIKRGMTNTRSKFTEHMNILLGRGPAVDEEFWEGLEEALILADVGAQAAFDIVERMRDQATRKALPDAYAVMDALTENIAATFATSEVNVFDENPVLVLFVGINGAGKTTTVGKIASAAQRAGRKVLLGSADTFRAAAIEQLEEWGRRSGTEIVQRERGADPASVCYDTIERGEALGSDFILIDTAGRLHTSDDLMRELQKVVSVVRKRSQIPVRTVLVIDATTGQNGLSQARLFNNALDLDALVVTKLDGTAKGGIALAVSHELGLPIAMIGVGEGLNDLMVFDAEDFSAALIGAEAVEDSAVLANDGTADAAEAPESGVGPTAAEAPGDGIGPTATEAPGDGIGPTATEAPESGNGPTATEAPGDGYATDAPLLEDSESRFADSESSSCAPLLRPLNAAASQPGEDGSQTVASPSPDTSSATEGLAESGGYGAAAADLRTDATLADASTTGESSSAGIGSGFDTSSATGSLAEPVGYGAAEAVGGTSSATEGLAEPGGVGVAASGAEGDRGFSWKDDFGNPDTMVDALGAQRELTVVTEDTGSEVRDSETVSADAPDAAAEQVEKPKKKEGAFKRMWRWLSE